MQPELYQKAELAKDIVELIDALHIDQFYLVCHDWGGVVAWALASRCPKAVSHLVVLNAPHPAVLARALVADSRQQQASGYLERLRQSGAESRLSENHFERLRWVLDIPPAPGATESAYVAACVEAWSQPGALTGALNWYRANDFGTVGRAWKACPPRWKHQPWSSGAETIALCCRILRCSTVISQSD